MNTASLENSKRLYEVSGWGDTHEHYGKMESGNYVSSCGLFEKHQECPAYDAGYLIEKVEDETITIPTKDTANWLAQYHIMRLEVRWADVKGYEGLYEVSNHGQVRSTKRRGSKGGEVKPHDHIDYRRVTLSKNQKKDDRLVHRLVAEAFVPNYSSDPSVKDINHKDGNRSNNHFMNLEWVNHDQNMKHAFSTGLANNTGSNHGMAKLSERQVALIKSCKGHYTATDLASRYRVARQTIEDIWEGRTWKHV